MKRCVAEPRKSNRLLYIFFIFGVMILHTHNRQGEVSK